MCQLAIDSFGLKELNRAHTTVPIQPRQATFAVHLFIWLSIFQRRFREFEFAKDAIELAQIWVKHLPSNSPETDAARARVMLEEAQVHFFDQDTAVNLAKQSQAIFRKLDDRWYVAQTLDILGFMAHSSGSSGSSGEAEALLEEGLAHRQAIGDLRGIAALLNTLGHIAKQRCQFEKAISLTMQSVEYFATIGDEHQQASTPSMLGAAQVHGGQFEESLDSFDESVRLYQKLNLPGEPGVTTIVRGFALMHLGRYEEAYALHEQTLAHPWPQNGRILGVIN